MSLVELIFGRAEIILSMAAALLLMLIALGLAIYPGLRAAAARQARRRAALAQKRVQAQTATPLPDTIQAADTSGVPASTPVQSAAPTAETSETPAAPARVTAAPEKTALPQQQTTPENAVSAAMQDILNSVFTDDEKFGRFAVLLEGQQPVDIHDLQAMSERVAAQLHARHAAAMQG